MSQEPEQSPSPTPTSSQSTTPESAQHDFSVLVNSTRPPNVVETSAAALEAALQKEADERREERFYWICVCAFLLDLATFPHMSWIGVICSFVLEVAVLIGLAYKYADERIVLALERILFSICEKIGWK